VSEAVAVQRVRIIFSKGETVKYISHLAVMRSWERIVRRADLPVAYSQGFNPRPKLAFASALSVGHTGRAEVLDIELRQRAQPQALPARLDPQLPVGFSVQMAWEVPMGAPSAQSQLRYAVYRVALEARQSADALRAGVDRLLSALELPRQRTVKGKVREYDLRPLIHDMWYDCLTDGEHVVGLALVHGSTGAGRVDEVSDELGMSEDLRSVERTRLIFDGEPIDLAVIKRDLNTGG
jgi:radical SAM-linked protein